MLTFCIILPLTCYTLPNSWYYNKPADTDHQRELERQVNSQRVATAEQFLQLYNTTHDSSARQQDWRQIQNQVSVDIAIVVVSVSRLRVQYDQYEPKYLTQVSATLFKLMQEARHNEQFHLSVSIAVCNADHNPHGYEEAQMLKKYLKTYELFSGDFNKPKTKLHVLEKEKQDYVFCIESALQDGDPRYVLVMEDDALPHHNLFPVLQHTLTRQRWMENKYDGISTIFYKLYHPDRLLTFISIEPERLPELAAIGAIFGTLLTGICYIVVTICNSSKSWNINQMWTLSTVYVVLIVLCIGRCNIVVLRHHLAPHLYQYVTPAPSCCTQAMLFTNHGARTIANYLKTVTCKAGLGKDMALENYLHNFNGRAYSVQPNLVKHIGMYSSLRTDIVDPDNLL